MPPKVTEERHFDRDFNKQRVSCEACGLKEADLHLIGKEIPLSPRNKALILILEPIILP